MRTHPAVPVTLLAFLLLGGFSQVALANDVQPRLFNNVPVGSNFLSISLARSDGEVTVDSSLPVADVDGSVDTLLMSYSRGLALAGRSALLTLAVPYADTHFEGLYLDQPATADRKGLVDPRIRLAVNLSGAPALRPEDFAVYQQRTIVGTSLEISVPAGRYLEDRLINIGSNRWGFFAQTGVSHRVENWTLEGALGLIWFTDNDEVLGTSTLEQDPIGTLRGTLRYHFRPALWVSAGFLYTYGGSTELNGAARDDRQGNWRAGMAFSMPLARRHQLQFLASEGVSARIGSSFTTYQVTYTYSY